MKKLFNIVLPILFILFIIGNAEAIRNQEYAKAWTASTVAVDTDWTWADRHGVSRTEIIPSIGSNSKTAIKRTIQISCPTDTIVNLQVKYNSITYGISANSQDTEVTLYIDDIKASN
jgi:hypothetical protein